MSDDMMMGSGGAPIPDGTVAPVAPPAGKPAGTNRRTLFIVIAVVVLVALLAGCGVAVMVGYTTFMSAVNNVASSANGTITPGSAATTASASATLGALPVPEIDNRDVFTPRNPFEVIAPIAISQPSTQTGGSEDESGTLVLQDIVTDNGVRKAVVRLDGTTYTVGAGEQVGTSSWSIVEVNSDNIVALYGDEQVTITLGQGSSK